MTSPLLRKPQTTAPVPSIPARKQAELNEEERNHERHERRQEGNQHARSLLLSSFVSFVCFVVSLFLVSAGQAQTPPTGGPIVRPYTLPSSTDSAISIDPNSRANVLSLISPAQLAPAPALIQTSFQPMPGGGRANTASDEATTSFIVQVEPPPPERLFRLESEQKWRQRVIQETRERLPGDRVVFPEEPILTQEKYAGRHWPKMHMVVEPYFVGFNRLYFQQVNFERYGWDLGPITSLLSALGFYKDLALVPYHIFSDPLRDFEYNTGYCLPGDPTPLLLYPPTTSALGLLGELGALGLVLVAFP